MEDLTRETLRAELTGLELRLVDRISTALEAKADRNVVLQHEARIADLEQSRAAREHLAGDIIDLERKQAGVNDILDERLKPLERLRWAIPSATALSAAAATIALALHFVH